MKTLVLALRILLGAVFAYAAYTKLEQPWLLFALSIDSYRLLPEWAVLTLARTLPWFELLLGIALAAGFRLKITATAATLLLGGFLAVMARSWTAGMGIDCGCFGFGEAISGKTLARDSALFAASALLTLAAVRRPRSTASAVPETLPPRG